MADWSDLSAQMDEAVDTALGDTITTSLDEGGTWAPVQGFVLPASSTGGIVGMDEPLGQRSRVKMPRDLFPAGEPDRKVRIQHTRLGAGIYRPCGGESENQGRYVLFDVQKV